MTERHRDTLRLLDEYTAVDALEGRHLTAINGLVKSTDRPFHRAQFVPGHLTASAFVLDPSRQALLLIFHAKLGRWLQPGGHVDDTDGSVEEAAKREVLEETGLTADCLSPLNDDCIFDVDVHVIPANSKRQEPEHQHFDVRFAFVSSSTTVRAGDDALSARWVNLDAFDTVDTDESVRRAVRKLTNPPRIPLLNPNRPSP